MFDNDLSDLGPLYHTYSLFGAKNEQLPGVYALNQAAKEPIILAYIMLALAKCQIHNSDSVSFAELFCADGYYAMAARKFGAVDSIGIDNNRDGHLNHAEKISSRLGIDRVQFLTMDVNAIEHLKPVDIVTNVGGLYHVSNPMEILNKSYVFAKRYLIVQTVVSLATRDEDYYESPAPGWDWGNRFSRTSFEKYIHSKNWEILDSHFNELEGNDRLEDRGSVYFLIKKND
jgi:hypothetical protein